MTVGDRIKEARQRLNIGQSELADKVSISKQTLYKYENNIITNIPSNNLEKIAKALETSPAYLMGWKDQSNVLQEKRVDSYSKYLRLMDAAEGCTDEQIKAVIDMLETFKNSKK